MRTITTKHGYHNSKSKIKIKNDEKSVYRGYGNPLSYLKREEINLFGGYNFLLEYSDYALDPKGKPFLYGTFGKILRVVEPARKIEMLADLVRKYKTDSFSGLRRIEITFLETVGKNLIEELLEVIVEEGGLTNYEYPQIYNLSCRLELNQDFIQKVLDIGIEKILRGYHSEHELVKFNGGSDTIIKHIDNKIEDYKVADEKDYNSIIETAKVDPNYGPYMSTQTRSNERKIEKLEEIKKELLKNIS